MLYEVITQRLSITDLHPRSHQPMALGKILISFNGEIYNHESIRERLGIEVWETRSDTEVVLRAYEKWGIGCLQYLQGMFARITSYNVCYTKLLRGPMKNGGSDVCSTCRGCSHLPWSMGKKFIWFETDLAKNPFFMPIFTRA